MTDGYKTYFVAVGNLGYEPGPGVYVVDRLPDDDEAEYIAYFGPGDTQGIALFYANTLKDILNSKVPVVSA